MSYDGDDLLRTVNINSTRGSSPLQTPVTERFDWSAGAQTPEVLTKRSPEGAAEFVYGYGRTFMDGPDGLSAFATDVYGSATQTRATRADVAASGYDAFGAPSPEADGTGHASAFGYRGALVIGDEINLRARVYLPAIGRFATMDPEDGIAGKTTVANPYPYADNDPVNHVDPSGRRPTDDDLRVPVDYGRARPQTARLHFPPQPGRGTVRVGMFIPTETAGLSDVDALRSHGDNRGFSPYADLSRYRAVASVTYEAGEAEFRINPSCGLGGPPGDCHDALPIIDDFRTFRRLFQHIPFLVHKSNRVRFEVHSGGVLKMRWAILNADKRELAPTIDGMVTIHPEGSRDVCLDYHRDEYPALEAYQYLDGQPPRQLLLQDAAWGPVVGLSPFPFTHTEGTTCVGENELAPGPFEQPRGLAA